MNSYLILGGYGEMGRVIAYDLFETSKGTIVIAGHSLEKARDFAKSFKSPRVKWAKIDIANQSELNKLLRGKNICVNSTNYYFNIAVMKACLKAGVPYLDLGGLFHMTKKQLKLHTLFKRNRLTAVLGCGATPGITNIMAAHGASFLDRVQEIHVKFGGKDFTRPSHSEATSLTRRRDVGATKYKTPFVLPYSAQTIFDEFTMKAAKLAHGTMKMIAPWSDPTVENFPKPIGKTLCGSVLHSELATFPKSFPGIRECSFQGGFEENFVAFIKGLIAQGFTQEPYRIWTVEFLNKFLPKKKMKIKDLEILRVTLFGIKNGKKKKVVVDCVAKSISRWNAPAGTVDTAVPPSIIAQMIAAGKIRAQGVLPPERCVDPEGFFRELGKRGMKVLSRVK